MTEAASILEVGIVLLAAALAGVACRRVGLPAVLGYLALGVVVSRFTPGFVADRHQLQLLADVGVVLLLFEVGIDIDVRALRREPLGILAAVPLQVIATTAIAALALFGSGLIGSPGTATVAFAIALSSSVVVVNITRSRRYPVDKPTARALVVWAILQDVLSLAGVAILAATLLPEGPAAIPFALLRLLAFGVFAAVLHALIVPRVLRGLRDEPDSFLAVAVSMALATAGVGAVIFGVPLALAAFVAGALLGLRPEAREARAVVLPFRDLFAVTFFVAVGTLLDPSALPENASLVALVLGLVAAKAAITGLFARLFSIRARVLQLSIGLAQIGEFSFVVLGLGLAAGVITPAQFSAVLAASVLSIAISAVAVRLVVRFARRAKKDMAAA